VRCHVMGCRLGQECYHDRFISENLNDVVIGESNILEIIKLSSITVKQKEAFSQTLLVRISLVIIIKVTCKMPRTFRVIHLIIPFDKGRHNG